MIDLNIQKKVKDKILISSQEWQRWTNEIVKLDGHWLVEILIVSPQEIKKINKKFRKKDEITDVLSFPIFDHPKKQKGNNILGSIIICPEQIEHSGRKPKDEWKTVYQHGLKHLIGKHHR